MRTKISIGLIIFVAIPFISASAQLSGDFELTVSGGNAAWKASAKMAPAGQVLTNDVANLSIAGKEIKFTVSILDSELRFSGKLIADVLSGIVEGFQKGNRFGTGTWTLKRGGDGQSTTSFSGNWAGTFELHPVAQPESSQPSGELGFNSNVATPAYPDMHPKVLFDEAHNNADTSSGRYRPFADLMRSDGYEIIPNKRIFSKATLEGFDVLVIVNASGPGDQRTSAAFTFDERKAVREWVDGGGALLLITDHAPYSAAVSDLSKLFGVDLTIGYTMDRVKHNDESDDQTELLFKREDGLIGDHPITRGRDSGERLNKIVSFTGTSLKGPAGSVPILKLSGSAMDVLPPETKQSRPEDAPPDHKEVSAAGRAQGLALESGKGRVVVFGEAAMLTAQVASKGFRFGMNVPGLDNRQLALNTMHWLSGLLK